MSQERETSATAFVKLKALTELNKVLSVEGGKTWLVTSGINVEDDGEFHTERISDLGQSNTVSTIFRKRSVTAPKLRPDAGPGPEEFKKIRKYDGFIIKRGDDSFWARLCESPSQYPTIEAEFDLEDLGISDRPLALEGTPVVWTLGYGRKNGTLKRESIVYIRRLLPTAAEELQKARTDVREMMSGIAWE